MHSFIFTLGIVIAVASIVCLSFGRIKTLQKKSPELEVFLYFLALVGSLAGAILVWIGCHDIDFGVQLVVVLVYLVVMFIIANRIVEGTRN